MDLTIIRIHVKKILTGNFVFMSLVAIIFGILTLFSKGQEKIIGSYTYIDMLWKGYIFLYIIFACELSKDLLQMEKITRRIEWLVAKGLGFNLSLYHISFFVDKHSLTSYATVRYYYIQNRIT